MGGERLSGEPSPVLNPRGDIVAEATRKQSRTKITKFRLAIASNSVFVYFTNEFKFEKR